MRRPWTSSAVGLVAPPALGPGVTTAPPQNTLSLFPSPCDPFGSVFCTRPTITCPATWFTAVFQFLHTTYLARRAAPGTRRPSSPWYVQGEEVSGWQTPREPGGPPPQDPSSGQGAEGAVWAGALLRLWRSRCCAFLFNLTLMQSEGGKENVAYLGAAACQHRRQIDASQPRILSRTCGCLALRGDGRFLCAHFSLSTIQHGSTRKILLLCTKELMLADVSLRKHGSLGVS